MNTAILCYIPDKDNYISNRTLTLAQGSLLEINHWTLFFKNQDELLENAVYGKRVKEFLKSNGILVAKNPYVGILYVKNEAVTELLQPLYGQEPIRVRNDLSEGTFSEAEKARKLLLNSKNQIFPKMVLKSKRLEPTLKYMLQITYEEAKAAKKFGLNVIQNNGEYSITIREMLRYRVLKYRTENPSLGPLRKLTEDACELWKDKIVELNGTNPFLGYYYQMYLRQLMNKYDEIKFKEHVVRNLSIGQISDMTLCNGYGIVKHTQKLSIASISKHKSLVDGNGRISETHAA